MHPEAEKVKKETICCLACTETDAHDFAQASTSASLGNSKPKMQVTVAQRNRLV